MGSTSNWMRIFGGTGEVEMAGSMLEICREVDAFFAGSPSVLEAVARLASNMKAIGIPYAISGDLALLVHGHRETTARPAIVIHSEDLQRLKERCLGPGYEVQDDRPVIVRDTESNVAIAVHLAGDFPGASGPEAVRFPPPELAVMGPDGIPYLTLDQLLDAKLAICAADPHAYKAMADVISLIRANQLSADYSQDLDPCVAADYLPFWRLAQIEDEY